MVSSWMPEVTESTEPSSKISQEAAQLTGLQAGTPVVAGGGDCAAQAVGSGNCRRGKNFSYFRYKWSSICTK